jgi:IS30 family transposase
MPVNPLTAHEREEIRAGILSCDTDGEIADCLGRHRRTVNLEISRNGGRSRYCAVDAQRRADEQRKRLKAPKLVADPALAAHVAKRLKVRDSPMTISIELARGVRGMTASISHECIYQAVHAGGTRGLPKGCHVGLHLQRRRRKRRVHKAPNSSALGVICSIHDRPPVALERVEVGHLEGDLIVGAYKYLSRALNRIPPQLRLSLAWDQGSEIARHREIALRCGIEIYIADPKSPWQRPTNENGNTLVRRFVGKGTDLNIYTTRQLRAIEHRINTIPRRSLGWDTAHNIYTQAVAMTP